MLSLKANARVPQACMQRPSVTVRSSLLGHFIIITSSFPICFHFIYLSLCSVYLSLSYFHLSLFLLCIKFYVFLRFVRPRSFDRAPALLFDLYRLYSSHAARCLCTSAPRCLRRAAAHLAFSLCSSLVFKLYDFCHVTSIRLSTTIDFYLFPTFLCVRFQACPLDSRFTSLSLCPPRHPLLWPRFVCVYSHGVS